MTGHDRQPDEPAEEAEMMEPGLVEPVAVGPGEPADGPPRSADEGDGAAGGPVPAMSVDQDGHPVPPADAADASLLGLIDRLTSLLERSELAELEVAAGGTRIILRSPAAIERPAAAPALDASPADAAASAPPVAPASATPAPGQAGPERPSVKAPLTGIFYGAPSPGATPYVSAGDHVSVGQIIGLIEAMKLFNEIKSDLAGRVVRVCADNGALVKAKQPLIEVEPA
jgi:acetyl-CoA carboxylase biotin carboxyl carrier protein